MFYHGVGGLVYYARFLKGLEARGIPVIAVEMPYVSLHIAPNVPIDDMCPDLRPFWMMSEIESRSAVIAGAPMWSPGFARPLMIG